jgi:hypothetical protein
MCSQPWSLPSSHSSQFFHLLSTLQCLSQALFSTVHDFYLFPQNSPMHAMPSSSFKICFHIFR